jgi:hypothetical protein
MRRVLARWERSGRSLREFGQQRGIPLSTLVAAGLPASWRAGELRLHERPGIDAVEFTEVPRPPYDLRSVLRRAGAKHEQSLRG